MGENEPNVLEYFKTKRSRDTSVQNMIFEHQNPKIVQAERLLFALLHHPAGSKEGYRIYKENLEFDKKALQDRNVPVPT